MIVTIFDYGAGNLHSLTKALAAPGVSVRTETDPLAALETDVLVLPGVGAFGLAAESLAPARNRVRALIDNGLPCVGICTGMQLLFEGSEEGEGKGLGVLAGRVRRLRSARVPHMGWNSVSDRKELAYFAHSYVCEPQNQSIIAARTTHETDTFASIVRTRNMIGVQFHPEKSGASGVRFLRACISEVLVTPPQYAGSGTPAGPAEHEATARRRRLAT